MRPPRRFGCSSPNGLFRRHLCRLIGVAGAGQSAKPLTWKCPSHTSCWRARITPERKLPDGPSGDHMGLLRGGVEGFTFGALFTCVTLRRNRCFSPPSAAAAGKEEADGWRSLNGSIRRSCASRSRRSSIFLPMEGLSYKLAVIAIGPRPTPARPSGRAMASGAPAPVHLHQVRGWWSTAAFSTSVIPAR